MADKSIGDLNVVPGSINDSNTLFVVQQSGAAYKVSGHEFITALTAILDGHGGISSISYTAPTGTSLDGTMTITLADNSTTTVTVKNGKGISSISKTGTSGLIDTYTISYNDGTSSTFSVTNGAKGDTGDAWYVWIKYAGVEPTQDSDIGDTPDDWIGIYSGTASTAPTTYTSYSWFQIKGEKGDTGNPATLSAATVGYQQSDSGSVVPEGSWSTTVPTAVQGKYLRTRIQIAFNTGSTITAYSVSRYGIDGTGAVVTVNGESPDTNGNVSLFASNITASDSNSIQAHLTTDEANITALQQDLAYKVLTPTAAFSIPASGSSVSKNMNGLTADHVLVYWGFSSSAENSPPCDLTWATYSGYFTITNTNGTTSETICPVFALPEGVIISNH